jgi:hypothetical protein
MNAETGARQMLPRSTTRSPPDADPRNRLEAAPRRSHRAPLVAKRKPKSEVARKASSSIVPIELSMIGSADGVPIELAGRGKFDSETRRLTLEIGVPRSLLLFDPALVAISLLDVLALALLDPRPAFDSDADSPAYVRSRTDLYDENGREAGGWRVVAELERGRGGLELRVRGQLLDCRQHIEPGERVVAVDTPWYVLTQPIEPEGALLAGALEARTGRGNGYRGVTTSILEGQLWQQPGQLVERIELQGVQVQRTAGTAGELVTLGARVSARLSGR